MPPSPVRRWAPFALVGLVAALLPLGLAAPAQSSPGCMRETGAIGSCDDTNPPVLTAGEVSVTATNWVATVGATATYSDADPDPIAYQCALDSDAFAPCGAFPGLTVGVHTMKVRAVDTHDAFVAACEIVCPLPYPEAPDFTEVEEQFTVTAGGTTPPAPGPGGAPETQISGAPLDRITPGQPVSLSRRPTVVLAASEPATFNCAVNARKVPCQDGVTVLKGLEPGVQVFVAQAVDKDGNFDATPASLTFYVPYNFSPGQGKGWKRVKSRASYAGDYVSTARKGAVLSVGQVRRVREVRLIAPVGPKLGRVAVRVGKGPWMKVRLTSATSEKLRVFELRDVGAEQLSGVLRVKALRVPSGGAVAVDAIVAR
jgi:hypothetical protein